MEERDKNQNTLPYHYILLVESFKEWLTTLGYAKQTVYNLPQSIKDYLAWLNCQSITQINQTHELHLQDYISYLKQRPHKRREGGISIGHINKHISAINKLYQYLALTGKYTQTISIKQLKQTEVIQRLILSQEEIKQLYQVAGEDLLGLRDQALLSIYYGCGLRKSEGLALVLNDVLFERGLIYVRKPKNKHERYVPMHNSIKQTLELYIYHARPLLLDEVNPTDSLILNEKGKPMSPSGAIARIKTLSKKAQLPKKTGIHTLRHSIATHLLKAGMELEKIAQFLGHRTLDSTQIYTHINNEKS